MFTTAEIEETFVTELTRLRQTVSELRRKAEKQDIDAETARQALDETKAALAEVRQSRDEAKQSLDALTTALSALINH